ncbi:MAG TPA: hypothetical protein VG742_03135 [Dongiaceae bacterium]|nr:hypothetical protein [Dongiaceae bacterium]
MQLLRVENPEAFAEAPEAGMDLHIATGTGGIFVVVGQRVAILLEDVLSEPVAGYFEQPWLRPGLERGECEAYFQEWLRRLRAAPPLNPAPLGFVVMPRGPLPATPWRPSVVHGHLPFTTTTDSSTVIYRWEAFPTSRRITRTPAGGTIAKDTYAAPASEVPFAITGFAAVARFALPNLMPACYRWELQPDSGTLIECGASVPLYGQSGGGVEVRFPKDTNNRCPIADPVILPPL